MGVRLRPAVAAPCLPNPTRTVLYARLSCAFVNNMPDGAFDATERQFLDLLGAGSGTDVVEVRALHHGRSAAG